MDLDVYLSGERIGALSAERDGGCSFAYAPELAEEVLHGGREMVPLSRSLPVRAEFYGPDETRPYIEGLLPEGTRRETIARELCVDSADSYALIAELGRDCPGAAVFLPAGETPRSRAAGSLAWLGEDELEQLLTAPEQGLFDPVHPLRMRFALPGERHKLALVRDVVGNRWAWPEPGAPSTHIVKPESGEPEDFAVNGMACTTAMRNLGLPVAGTELMTIAGRRCLVSRRFDRWGEGIQARRLHQESFCQALGIPPASGEPGHFHYRQSCELLREIDAEDSIEILFALVFCSHLFGAADTVHGKSSALLYTAEGPVLAPLPDVASLAAYEPQGSQPSIFELAGRNSSQPGLGPTALDRGFEHQASVVRALQTVGGLPDALEAVAEQARREGWYSPLIDRIPPRDNPHTFWLYSDFLDP